MSEVLKPSDFVHLHNHTHYSVLDGMTKVPDLVSRVKELGMEAVAVTDHGTMSGVIELYKIANENGIKPILGFEAYMATRSRTDRNPSKDKERFHLTLLAMNNQGYENLCRLTTESYLNGVYYKPRIDHEILEKWNEGVICLSGCAGSEISEKLRADDYEKARDLATWHKNLFGDRFYLEMQDHGHPETPSFWPEQKKVNEGLQKLSQELDIPLVITCDGHYLFHEDQDAHEILLSVGTASNLSDKNRMSLKAFQLHLIDPKDIIKRWGKDFPEAIKNTKRIANRCTVNLELGRILIPKFPVPKGKTEKSFLSELVYQGLTMRYAEVPKEKAEKMTPKEAEKVLPAVVNERVKMELAIIEKMGYYGYFLIVQDFINWGKNQGIVFGPGRSSAAGSIIAFALRITDLDPLKYDLLFERFLNPDRISMPDIDIDIQDTRRNEVVEYCTEKYGAERVASICTFGKMMAKNAVRDVARVLEVPYAEADRIAKMVPDPVQGHHVSLKKAIKEDPDLKQEYETNPTAKEVIDYASILEGTIRSHGVHACGVVIAPDDLVKFLPLEMAQKGVVATQFPMGHVEELGLLKMDFLGLKNLTIINNAARIARKVYDTEIDIAKVPLDDKKTYELFQKADTTGVFQLESAGMKRYLKDLKATTFEDIVAMVALYRPGPMQFIDSFIARKHGREPIKYLHEGLKNSLQNTYGILVYQEQFMQISKEWCGFTGGQADTLRKAVGKKKIDLMMKMKPEFIEGAVKSGGATKEIAETFWNQLEEFANYCFNKSHAACYALIAYWTAYIKAHFPDAFMAALMTSDAGDNDRLAVEIAECKKMGLAVLPPSVNESFEEFSILKDQNKIRFSMSAVKGVGNGIVEEVVSERKARGNFKSVCDFAKRVNSTRFNKKSWEATIKAGGFDEFGDRSDLLFNLEKIQAYGAKIQKESVSGQIDLFSSIGQAEAFEVPEVEIRPAPTKHLDKEKLAWERELLGLYISAHPLDKYTAYFNEQTLPVAEITTEIDGASVVVGGIISTIRTILTKNNTRMAFMVLEDKTGETEVIVFPKTYELIGAKLVQDTVVKVKGEVNCRDRDGRLTSEVKINASEIVVVDDLELENYQSMGKKVAGLIAKGANSRKKPPSKVVAEKTAKVAVSDVGYAPQKPISLKKLFIKINHPDNENDLLDLRKLCHKAAGLEDVVLVFCDEAGKKAVKMPFKVEISDELLREVKRIFGKDCVAVK
ncbi:MAG: DNA polymerase III subunit alpha [Candidatus Nomurabacteria bacterium]|jgi:DNA polymerase-3 subunit alpha|nr:DNA polymerase III subunit alpha [Candidatus Nomurabacteria bacterium]